MDLEVDTPKTKTGNRVVSLDEDRAKPLKAPHTVQQPESPLEASSCHRVPPEGSDDHHRNRLAMSLQVRGCLKS
ncbi:hypothetical protein [Planomonospora venezuelensis]|uniref:Uncharacterized protein n=1 Tax=Planomonospora venezuelensis TaxID=1999 RepID=A0A841CU66_PLAVE|nr:hypothetical protein [Planomonospora venezuelensis]MBB5960870.1 hypothetical protein [Planomonospora venezuelensis]GIN01104.1 hypothetical protein Pve01_27620 [Planomonospora venezuelensis]